MIGVQSGRQCLCRHRRTILLEFAQSQQLRQPIAGSRAWQHFSSRRAFSSAHGRKRQHPGEEEPFVKQAGRAWRNTKIEWKPIPVAVGVAFLGAFQLWRISQREAADARDEAGNVIPKRERIRPSGGGWQVSVMSTLPLKAISRVWGRFNELDIPYYLRVPGFKLYGWIFGVNFDEIKEPDLHVFPNLASFFFRELKPGVRPLDPNPRALLSPADGKVLQFGVIENGEVEQVKGMTYKVDALLGQIPPSRSGSRSNSPSRTKSDADEAETKTRKNEQGEKPSAISKDEEFARVNGISYTLPNLFQGGGQDDSARGRPLGSKDQSTQSKARSEAEVSADLATTSQPWWSPFGGSSEKPTRLYYLVVYLAPGDYHRFHSPVSWVCSTRRHFAGELYSVSPYVQRTLPGLFTLNERVVLLGRWKYGFFSYTSVGATNVGSIKINFDKELRTNSLTTDTEADRQAQAAKDRGEPYSGFSEASYGNASEVLEGHALSRGEEMGGFQLGSSIVMVFEAPSGDVEGHSGWKWNCQTGQKVQMGQALGWVEGEEQRT